MMRTCWNFLGDPIFHLLGVGLILLGLAVGGPPKRPAAEAKIIACTWCRTSHYPDQPCNGLAFDAVVHVRP